MEVGQVRVVVLVVTVEAEGAPCVSAPCARGKDV
jgi:hypothetical protein